MQNKPTPQEYSLAESQDDDIMVYSSIQWDASANLINKANDTIFDKQINPCLPAQSNQNFGEVKNKETLLLNSENIAVADDFQNTCGNVVASQYNCRAFLSIIDEKSSEYYVTESIIIEEPKIGGLAERNIQMKQQINNKDRENQLLRYEIEKIKFQKQTLTDLKQYYNFIIASKDQELLSLKKEDKIILQKYSSDKIGKTKKNFFKAQRPSKLHEEHTYQIKKTFTFSSLKYPTSAIENKNKTNPEYEMYKRRPVIINDIDKNQNRNVNKIKINNSLAKENLIGRCKKRNDISKYSKRSTIDHNIISNKQEGQYKNLK